MGRFTKRLIVGLTAALTVAAGGAFADFTLSDFDDGTNVSNIGTYYYMYSSCSPVSRGPCKQDDVHYLLNSKDASGESYAGPADEYGPVSYKARAGGVGGAGYCAVLRVDTLPAHSSTEEYYPGFGMGILISGDDDKGYGADFNKVTGVKFKYKTTTPGVTVIFKMETIENSFDGPYGDVKGADSDPANAYAVKFVASATEWTEKTIEITPITPATSTSIGKKIDKDGGTGKAGDLQQFAYWGYNFTFDRANVTKLAWAINSDDNATITGSTSSKSADVWIDDVVLVGTFTYVSPDICTGCTSASFTTPTPNKKLSDFENADPLLNERGYYWFHYTDQDGGGSSELSGLIENQTTGDMIMVTAGNGRDGAGAHIDYTMGAAYSNGKATVEPFVGIGANVYDDDNTKDFLNAGAFTGIYFEYKTSANVSYFDLEVTDSFDAVGKAADADGEVYYTRIEGSSTWKSATVPFSKLVLPTWVATSGERRKQGNTLVPLDLTKLAQIKFKHRGSPTVGGDLSIDNVYLYGADSWGTGVGVKLAGSKAKTAGLRATYSRGKVGVNWSTASSVASGKIQLVNTKGRVVASTPIANAAGKVTASLGAGNIPTGMYFVRVNAKDVNGKKIVQQAPISIVK